MIVSAEFLYDWLCAVRDREFPVARRSLDPHFDIFHFLSLTKPQFRNWLLSQGLGVSRPWRGKPLIHFDPTKFKIIEDEINLLLLEQFSELRPRAEGHGIDLRKDEDFDYNIFSIQIVITILQDYIKKD